MIKQVVKIPSTIAVGGLAPSFEGRGDDQIGFREISSRIQCTEDLMVSRNV
jgi:hypothetical protein